jgi:hypothetical protein
MSSCIDTYDEAERDDRALSYVLLHADESFSTVFSNYVHTHESFSALDLQMRAAIQVLRTGATKKSQECHKADAASRKCRT